MTIIHAIGYWWQQHNWEKSWKFITIVPDFYRLAVTLSSKRITAVLDSALQLFQPQRDISALQNIKADYLISKIILFMFYRCGCIIIISLLYGCQTSEIEWALDYAGENRSELEKVLNHYSVYEEDSLKKKAAIFLIQNMPGHYSYKGNDILKFYAKADSILRNFPSDFKKKRPYLDTLSTQLETLSQDYPELDKYLVEDIHIITSDFLIKNIDDAFELWTDGLWAKHLIFDEFCEYILPYKVVELQQLDNWRDSLRGKYSENISNEPYSDQNVHSAFHAAVSINKELKDKIISYNTYGIIKYKGYKLLNSSTIYKMFFGDCGDYSTLGVAVLRSEGVPVALDHNPHWGRRRQRHSWSMLYNNYGKTIPFHGCLGLHPGDVFYPTDPMPKVYRKTYARNLKIQEHNQKAQYLKNYFSVFTRDVTHEYMSTSDICIPLHRKVEDQYAYLCVFDTDGWAVVDFGYVKNETVSFTNIGRDILYVVQGYDGKNMVPVSDIFGLTASGEVQFMQPNHLNLQTMKLTRKNSLSSNLANMQSRILGGKIQASNDENFHVSKTIYTIDSLLYPDIISIQSKQAYRYWRYLGANGTYGTLAELQFYPLGTDTIAKGAILGNHDLYDSYGNARKEKVFDGNWLTYSDSSEENGAWIGLDMGKPVYIDRVRCIPRFDDNGIRVGDRYQLKYWEQGQWNLVCDTIANDKFIYFHNVPSNAFYLLSNITRGKEERVFTYNNAKQTFW